MQTKRAVDLADPEPPIKLADADPSTGQNIVYSLGGQEIMSHAPRYNGWLVDSLRGAWQGCENVLDVGCSIGNVTHVVADRLTATGSREARVVGVEIIPEAAERFGARFRNRPDLHAVCTDIMEPSPELMRLAPFDAAVTFNVLEHIQDDVALYETLDAQDRHFRRYTPPRLRARLEAAGFEVVSLRRVNIVGAFLWFAKTRLLRTKHARVGEIAAFDRMVPALRRIDALLGPPFGQSLAAVARLRPEMSEKG